ncbi:MAG: hypothetical protein K5979_03120 [Ruminococcus sp.]|jgi:phenylpyruvate tautomerase PptA (4-oxalocrotonate tautomerase family)|nr:hypothetical protein [Ruminococcus sp.]
MPYIDLKTNVKITKEDEIKLKSGLGEAITAIPGKTEAWLMVGIEPEYSLYFKGEDSPAAMVTVSILGGASAASYTDMTARICNLINRELDIPADRVYVQYFETENWGWNGSNF